jgi:ribosomal protein S18 acetylase RimI-like enzyme
MSGPFAIVRAETESHFASARVLFLEYAASLGVDLCFQDFDSELASLAQQYAPPSGCLLLAMVGDDATACVALRRWDDDVCEMKRLYVQPTMRGSKLGRRLAEEIIDEARRIGYKRMRLDTLPSMGEAQSLYRSLGFREVDAYRFNPVAGTVYMELELR